MLRVGLTGGLGSGKSTAAQTLSRALGAHVSQSDEIGRELMQPGQAVYAAIVERFGTQSFCPMATWIALRSRISPSRDGRVEELNASSILPSSRARRSLHDAIFAKRPERRRHRRIRPDLRNQPLGQPAIETAGTTASTRSPGHRSRRDKDRPLYCPRRCRRRADRGPPRRALRPTHAGAWRNRSPDDQKSAPERLRAHQ